MDIFSNLTLLILMWCLGVASAFGILVISLLLFFKITSKGLFKIILTIILFICIVAGWLSLPFFTEPIAVFYFSTPKAINILKLQEKIAIISAIKAETLYELSRNYEMQYMHNEAIEAFEKALKITGKPDKIQSGLICVAYFHVGDREKLHELCKNFEDTIAVDYLRTKEYDKALGTINQGIEKYEKENRTNGVCKAKAIRAAIYKQKGDINLYNKDYNDVINNCPTYYGWKDLMEADNIMDVYFKDNK